MEREKGVDMEMQPEGLPQNSPGQRPGFVIPPTPSQPEGLLQKNE
jgi:hypothetical protein